MKMGIVLALSFAFISAMSGLAAAEIYKYKDEKGQWRFTDKKPASNSSVVVDYNSRQKKYRSANTDTSSWEGLAKKLEVKYRPQSPIESATLAVVKIESTLGQGSGFFVSDSGYIITNRHVVRPKSSSGWKNTEGKLKEEEEHFKQRFESLKSEKENIEAMKENLKSYKHEAENPGLYYNAMSKEQYASYEQRYKKAKIDYVRRYKKTKKEYKEFQSRKNSLTRRSLNSSVAQRFDVTFKDSSKAKAQLVKISTGQDIALLKLDGYITPYLRLNDVKTPGQGKRVYAIGSPLGQSDSMTAGIITRVSQNEIVTDATILPGNSGGPLIDESGVLIGVNTLKMMEVVREGADGLGVAIPIGDVFSEFGNIVTPPAEESSTDG